MIYYLAPKGCFGLERYVTGPWRQSNYPEILSLSYEDAFSRRELPTGTWIFSAVNQLTPAGKRLSEIIWQALTDAGQPVLNRPKLLPSRYSLLDQMYRTGINEFRSYLPGEIDDNLRYPVFVRLADQHTGSMSPLFTNRRQLESFLWWQRLRGYKSHELLVVEFCDTANDRGEYRKYSATYVQGEVAAQYLNVDRHWMVKHGGSIFRDEWVYEEREHIKQNVHATEVKKIFKMAKIDYGRIDYGLLDGKFQVWEINTNPSTGGPPRQSNAARTEPDIRKVEVPGRKLFFERFHTMLESIDSPHDPSMNVKLVLPENDLQIWRKEVRTTQRRLQRREVLSQISEWPPVNRARVIAKRAMGIRGK